MRAWQPHPDLHDRVVPARDSVAAGTAKVLAKREESVEHAPAGCHF
jgi:hypothetical protein